MVGEIRLPKSPFNPPAVAVKRFKVNFWTYVLQYCKQHPTQIQVVDEYLRKELNCPLTTKKILIQFLQHLRPTKVFTLQVVEDIRIRDRRLADLLQLLEWGNRDIAGLHLMQKGIQYANTHRI